MPRWIVFDQHTAFTLRSRLPQEAVFEAPGRAALEYALENTASVVTVLPVGLGNHPAIAVFRHPHAQPALPTRPPIPTEPPQPTKPPTRTPAVRATGFLGLNDESIFEEEIPDQKSKWWRFWE